MVTISKFFIFSCIETESYISLDVMLIIVSFINELWMFRKMAFQLIVEVSKMILSGTFHIKFKVTLNLKLGKLCIRLPQKSY